MKELLILTADITPVGMLLDQLQKAVEVCKANPSEENLKSVQLSCMLFNAKRAMEGKGAAEFLRRIDETEAAVKLAERLKPTS